jgi:predicted enzyme related to lactoylglutathione lyase
MSDSHGKFVWYELMTTDPKSAESFYRSVIGWGGRDAGMPGMSYTLLTVGDMPVAGLMEMPQRVADSGAPPFWTGYVYVDDVDASAAQAKKDGGAIHHAPDDIPGVGRFAVIADPQGAAIALFKTPMAAGPSPTPGTPGHAGWRELYAGDREAAFAFYSKLFGWTKAAHHDMGPMGLYQLFAAGGETIGGMMNKPPQGARAVLAVLFQCRRDRCRDRTRSSGRRKNPQWPDGGSGRKLDRSMRRSAGRYILPRRAAPLMRPRWMG